MEDTILNHFGDFGSSGAILICTKLLIEDAILSQFWDLGPSGGHLGATLALQGTGHVFQDSVLKDFASKWDPSGSPKIMLWDPKMTICAFKCVFGGVLLLTSLGTPLR